MKFTCSANELYNALCLNKKYLINILRKYFPKLDELNNDDFIYEFEKHRDDIKMNNLCNSFIEEFKQSTFTGERFEINAKKMVFGGSYELPPSYESIHTISDLPSLAQIVNNHFKFYLNFDINFFSSISKFKPLLIRDDNIALVLIHDITSEEMICESPYHELPGLKLTTINTHPFTNSKYMSLCVVDLNNKYIHEGFHDDFDELCDKENITSTQTECNNYTLLIDAGFFC